MIQKTAYKATNNRSFNFKFMWLVGIGYHKEYFHYDAYSCQEFESIYLPFLKITATQYFRKFEQP